MDLGNSLGRAVFDCLEFLRQFKHYTQTHENGKPINLHHEAELLGVLWIQTLMVKRQRSSNGDWLNEVTRFKHDHLNGIHMLRFNHNWF